MDPDTIFSIFTGVMVIAVIYMLMPSDMSNRQQRALAVFALASGMFIYLYMQENPEFLKDTSERIAVALVGLVLFFVQVLRQR